MYVREVWVSLHNFGPGSHSCRWAGRTSRIGRMYRVYRRFNRGSFTLRAFFFLYRFTLR